MALPAAFAVTGEPCGPVMELLTNLMAEARAGTLRAMIYVSQSSDGHSHGMAYDKDVSLLRMVGEMERAKCRLLRKLEEES